MNALYDTHFHLDLHENRENAIREIEENQIYTIAVTNLPDLYRRGQTLVASKYIRHALGFHPELLPQFKNQIPLMWELLSQTRYIGEVGLDFCIPTYKNDQINFFSELIERCRFDSQKILTIHSRRAVSEILDIIGDNFRFRPILHWYSGSKTNLLKAIDKGYYFSVNQSMMYSSNFLNLLPLIPKERILLETDSPFTNSMDSHSRTLHKVVDMIRQNKAGINVWKNFLTLLT